jgi:hypothetical protein
LFGVLQEYSIINNILLYDIRIGGVDYTILLHLLQNHLIDVRTYISGNVALIFFFNYLIYYIYLLTVQ